MWRNYLAIATRNLWKQKGYTLINLFGMALGMSCCFLILIFIRHELSYDQFHRDVGRLYRVNYQAKFSGSTFDLNRIPAPIGPRLTDQFPQIESAARFFQRSVSVRDPKSERMFEIERALFADSTATRVFDFELLQGNAQTALSNPFSVVLTAETARRIFGDQPAVGRLLLLAEQTTPFTVGAVVRDFPENAHLHFDLLAPFSNIVDLEPAYARTSILRAQEENWLASYTYTYVRLKPGASPSEVDQAFPQFMKKHGDPNFIDKQGFVLFPVRDIHLKSEAQGEPEPVANPAYLRLFALVGLLILFIACINFINLSNAIYLDRMKEVGVRKVLGAGQGGLIAQFMVETLLICSLAFILALPAVQLLLPHLDTLSNRHLSYDLLADARITLTFAAIFVAAGLLAGAYPAFIASRFEPVTIFQRHIGHTGGRQWVRRSLITVQFVVGIALLSGTLILLAQLDFWKNRPLGFERNHIVSAPLFSANLNSAFIPGDAGLRERTNSFEERLLQNPNIEAVTLASNMPGSSGIRNLITTDKISANDNVFFPCVAIDYDFVQTFGLSIIAGRNLDKNHGSDHLDAFLINELAAKSLGWKNPEEAVGQNIGKGSKKGKVVGVVRDFHNRSLQAAIEPMVMDVNVGGFTTFGIRLKPERMPETLQFLEKTWADFFPGKAFEYSFLDEDLQNAYQDEQRLATLVGYFSGLAIFLSCFGLFGLISFTIHQKTKEIGIRKVLGASTPGLVGLLSRSYLQLVVVALLAATPLTWYVMDDWLDTFTYRIEIHWWLFALAGLAAIGIAFLTVGVQSLRAAMANPVESLRSE